MLPYYLLFALVVVLGYFLCERKQSKKRDLIFLCIVTLVMIVMSSIRHITVGIDTETYMLYFKQVSEGGASFVFSGANTYLKEIGYSLLNYVVTLFTDNFQIFLAVFAVLVLGLRAVAVYRFSSSAWISMVVFLGFGFFSYTMCTMRQELGISIFLLALKPLQEKKILPYMLITLLAASTHMSMLVMIPVYFIIWLPLNWKTLSLYVGGTVLVLLFSQPILSFITKYVYTWYTEGNIFLDGRDVNTAFIPIILFLVAALFKNALLERNPKNLPLLNMTAYACFLFVLTLKHFIFQRVALLFLPAAMFLLPEMLACIGDGVKKAQLALVDNEKFKGPNKNQLIMENGKRKRELKDAKSLYSATIGFILFFSLLYMMFIMSANRLNTVPYCTMFGAGQVSESVVDTNVDMEGVRVETQGASNQSAR